MLNSTFLLRARRLDARKWLNACSKLPCWYCTAPRLNWVSASSATSSAAASGTADKGSDRAHDKQNKRRQESRNRCTRISKKIEQLEPRWSQRRKRMPSSLSLT